MKKLTFNLGGVLPLSKEQMKKITGGEEDAVCFANCGNGDLVLCSGSNCMAFDGTGCFAGGTGKFCPGVLPI